MSLILPGLVVDHIRFYQRLDQKKELLIKIKILQQEGYKKYNSDDNLTLKTSLNKLEQYHFNQCHRKLSGQATKYDRNSINSFLYRSSWNF